jgi:hypothetical protein
MYDLPDFYLVANPNRPLLHRRPYTWPAPRRRRLAHHRDPARPTGCPAPAAPFRPIMRLYQPEPAVLDGAYTIPPITKLAT